MRASAESCLHGSHSPIKTIRTGTNRTPPSGQSRTSIGETLRFGSRAIRRPSDRSTSRFTMRSFPPPSPTAPAKDAYGQPSYLGPKHPLVAIGNPIKTNAINVTHTYGKNVKATFTNGILSTQNLARQLESVKKGPSRNAIKDANSDKPAERAKAADQKENHLLKTLKDEIQRPDSKIREFLMGDVYKFVTELVDRARKERGQVYLALYELHDKQLIKLLVDAMKSKLVHIILTTAGKKGDKK